MSPNAVERGRHAYYPSPFAHLDTAGSVLHTAALLVFDDPGRTRLLAQAAQRLAELLALQPPQHNGADAKFLRWARAVAAASSATAVARADAFFPGRLGPELRALRRLCLPSLHEFRALKR